MTPALCYFPQKYNFERYNEHVIGLDFMAIMPGTMCTGVEPVPLSSAEGLKQSAITTGPRKYLTKRNNEKYIERRSNGIITDQKIMNEP